MVEQFIEILEKMSTGQLSVEAGAQEIEQFLKNGLIGKFEGYKRRSVSFFISCLDACDPCIPPAKNSWDKMMMDWRRVSGDFAYPPEEVRKQATRLLKVLRGQESFYQRIMFFLSN